MRIISDKIVATRKKHFCNACCRKFPKKTKMRTQVNTYEGDIGTWRECPTCNVLLEKHRHYFTDDGWCESNCVHEALDVGETPEILLTRLNSKKSISHE